MDDFTKTLERLKNEKLGRPLEDRYKCSKCQDSGFIKSKNGNFYVRCNCYEMQKIEKLLIESGISEEFSKKTFDNFETRGKMQLENSKRKAIQYVESFERFEHERYNSILFSGQVGAGKTHLGTAICGRLMNTGIAVTYMAYRNVVTKIKQNIIDEEAYSRELKKYTSARVLYIDDLLKGRLTETDINIMYEIVNYRYMNHMPIIISTEKSPMELLEFDEAIGSRLIEMCKGNIIQFRGKELNYRMS